MMSDGAHVTRVRVSLVAGRIYDRLRTVGSPNAFEGQLVDPQTVCGLPVSLPFASNMPIDTAFWEAVAERRLTIPIENPAKVRRAAVPLRLRAHLDAPADFPRLEAHIHPFGIAAVATVDLMWPQPVGIDDVRRRIRELEQKEVSVGVGAKTLPVLFSQAAVAASEEVGNQLADQQVGSSWAGAQHRLVTIISGDFDGPPTAMPDRTSALLKTLHYLSGGGEALPDPQNAFVAQWSGAGYSWPPASLVYTLNSGTSVLAVGGSASPDADSPAGAESNSDRHRRYLLTLAYLTALSGLVKVCANYHPDSVYFDAWGKTAARRLGQMFGPAGIFKEWGQLPQAFLSRTGSSDDVKLLTGQPLQVNPVFPIAQW